jgi:ribosomal protein L32E
MPSGHKAFLVHNPKDVELLLMHNRTYAAEYVSASHEHCAFLFQYLISETSVV